MKCTNMVEKISVVSEDTTPEMGKVEKAIYFCKKIVIFIRFVNMFHNAAGDPVSLLICMH